MEERVRRYKQRLEEQVLREKENRASQARRKSQNKEKQLNQRERYRRHQKEIKRNGNSQNSNNNNNKSQGRSGQGSNLAYFSGYGQKQDPKGHSSHRNPRDSSVNRKRQLTPKITRQSHQPRNADPNYVFLESNSYHRKTKDDSNFIKSEAFKDPKLRTEPLNDYQNRPNGDSYLQSAESPRSISPNVSPTPNRRSIERRKMLYREMLSKNTANPSPNGSKERGRHSRLNDDSPKQRLEMTPSRSKLFQEFRQSKL